MFLHTQTFQLTARIRYDDGYVYDFVFSQNKIRHFLLRKKIIVRNCSIQNNKNRHIVLILKPLRKDNP